MNQFPKHIWCFRRQNEQWIGLDWILKNGPTDSSDKHISLLTHWRSGLSVRVSGCQKLQMTAMRLNDKNTASSGDRSRVIQFKFLQPDQQETLMLLKFHWKASQSIALSRDETYKLFWIEILRLHRLVTVFTAL